MIRELIYQLVNIIHALGYPGLILLMAMESSFIPLPSELVLPPAGYLVHQGKMNMVLVILCGVAGSILGALFNYWIGVRYGRNFLLKYGKYFGLNEKRYLKTELFFIKHGEISTFVGRLLLGVRHFISFPAGVARMPMRPFIFYTAAGSAIWCSILTILGYYAGQEEELLNRYYREITMLLLGFCAVLVLIYFLFYRRRQRHAAATAEDVLSPAEHDSTK